jgi:glycosyltransferase involved in cell wall biosynthesis
MARILFLTELLPYPLTSGAKIRGYYVLRHLAARHAVTLLSFVRPDDRPEDVAHLAGFLERVVTVPMQRSWARNARAAGVSLVSGRPAIIAREEIGAMRRQVESLLDSGAFDVVHADQIPMAQYGLLGRREGGERRTVRRVLDQHNATFQILGRLAEQERNGLKQALLAREARAFARYEAAVCQQFDQVTFVSEEDRRLLAALMPDGALEGCSQVIPICVDPLATPAVAPVAAPFRVTHVGTMYWPPNVEGLAWFWAEVWPEVRRRAPGARLTLIGKNPPAAVRAWGETDDVEVTGYVAALTAYLAETAVFVVPLHAAGGMRVKIVDAWCWGAPVVSTSIGAEGIAVRDGENLLLADTATDFVEAVVRVVGDADLQARLRAAGRLWVEERYDWRRVYDAWDGVYGRLLGD